MRTPIQRESKTDLSGFSYHTGGTVRRLDPDEVCPILFRDVGLEAMIRFLQRDLKRLCGPTSPITYLRDCNYIEPYTDYGMIGRIMILQPMQIRPWHSGLDSIFVAPRNTHVDDQAMVFLPAEIPFDQAAKRFGSCKQDSDIKDVLGSSEYEESKLATCERLISLKTSHTKNERLAAPLRRMFQSPEQQQRDLARQLMDQIAINEIDLCTAWHHLPGERREHLQDVLPEIEERLV